MKKLFICFFILLFIAGCDSKPTSKKGKDGYYFEQETFVRTEFPVQVVLVQSEKEMIAIMRQKSIPVYSKVNPKDVAAFSIIRNNDPTCTLYIIDPKVSYQPEYIGHEFVHCIYGIWHREPQS